MGYKLPTVFIAIFEEEAYQNVYPIASEAKAEKSSNGNSLKLAWCFDEEIHVQLDPTVIKHP